jgi:hypothetical protein
MFKWKVSGLGGGSSKKANKANADKLNNANVSPAAATAATTTNNNEEKDKNNKNKEQSNNKSPSKNK